jgi:hypothetical protein
MIAPLPFIHIAEGADHHQIALGAFWIAEPAMIRTRPDAAW